MTLESKENYPQHTKKVQNSLGFVPEVKALHKPRGDLVLCAMLCLNIIMVLLFTAVYSVHSTSWNGVWRYRRQTNSSLF